MVVDCLEDADDTLKLRTLDLLYKMTNKYLKVRDEDCKIMNRIKLN